MSRPLNTRGGGDNGIFLDFPCFSDSALTTDISELIAAGSSDAIIQDVLVAWTLSDDYEVGVPAAGAVAHGQIHSVPIYDQINSVYRFTARIWAATDTNGTYHYVNKIKNAKYTGSLSLGDNVENATGTDHNQFADGGTNGMGVVIALDVPAASYCDVLMG